MVRGRRREPGRRVRQHPVRVDVVRRWPKGRKWGLCLHDAVTHTSTVASSNATANEPSVAEAHIGANTTADAGAYAGSDRNSGRPDEGSHTQPYASAIATADAATNIPTDAGALAAADARALSQTHDG